MGHIRLGVLPKYPRWRTVIRQLNEPSTPVAEIADKVLDNTQEILEGETAQLCVGYCVWFISQLTLSAKSDNFSESISVLGMQVSESTSATDFLARAFRVSTKQIDNVRPHSAINNLASLALRETLTRAIGSQSNTLFGSRLDDIQIALKKFSTQKQFSNLLHIFFTSFLRRTLDFVLDKELANHMGPDKRFRSLEEVGRFSNALESFAGQTTRIVDTFSGGWYSKKVWQEGAISEKDASGFVYIALKKLRSDLEISQAE